MPPSSHPSAIKIRQPIRFEAQLEDIHLRFETSFGIFSPKEIDEGTRLLLRHLKIEDNYDCLDLGCGYGAIGLWMAKKACNGKVVMLDKDFVAIEHCKNNIQHNNINNATAKLSNGFSEMKDEKFDLIVSNIPAKVGNEMLYLFIYDAFHHLKENGQFVVVTVNGLRHFCKRVFNEIFGNYDKIKQGSNYTISACKKIN
ncbi:MAG: class I SAM-dependent methyltransferase [Gammaproteobacteria bacterium]|nr:class I SAM-dependent methyltransferase [Gammaproteobacteria bacterium]